MTTALDDPRIVQRVELFALVAWCLLAAFVGFRIITNDGPFDYVTTLAAWWGGVASVSVVRTVLDWKS